MKQRFCRTSNGFVQITCNLCLRYCERSKFSLLPFNKWSIHFLGPQWTNTRFKSPLHRGCWSQIVEGWIKCQGSFEANQTHRPHPCGDPRQENRLHQKGVDCPALRLVNPWEICDIFDNWEEQHAQQNPQWRVTWDSRSNFSRFRLKKLGQMSFHL